VREVCAGGEDILLSEGNGRNEQVSPRPVRHFPRQASQLKSRICLTILAVMPGVGNVSPDEGIMAVRLREEKRARAGSRNGI